MNLVLPCANVAPVHDLCKRRASSVALRRDSAGASWRPRCFACRKLNPSVPKLLRLERTLRLHTDIARLTRRRLGPFHPQLRQVQPDPARIGIECAAGTGKTSLARTKAIQLAASGQETLLLCWNAPLGRHLNDATGRKERLTVSSFGSLVNRIRREARIPTADSGDDRSIDWGVLLEEALDSLPARRYDAIVIDEGQDSRRQWLGSIDQLLRDVEKNVLFVFHDRMQMVHNRESSIADALPASDIELYKVLRNSRQIGEMFRALLPSSVVLSGPEGPSVRFHSVRQNLLIELQEILISLTQSQDVPPSSIAVLFKDMSHRQSLVFDNAIGAIPVALALDIPDRLVVDDSIRRFKGLEQQVVILVEPSR